MLAWSRLRYGASKTLEQYLDFSSPSKELENALLHGLYDSKYDYYRSNLDLTKASTILSEEGIFWEAAKLDSGNQAVDEFLRNIATARSVFIKSRSLIDRSQIMDLFQTIYDREEGEFVLYLGGF